ncbi:pyruvate dehydrogenase complex dihydrolipoamide acetyltransferase [Pseudonocardia sp. TMWB2A]|uniref:pyruvate dehydrogenase complex dihydrolipoamide acetyltransferase n=1 Tax=Pseudonocardia sp. TMWB2A TaxID=687430 RepID=UPI00307F796B
MPIELKMPALSPTMEEGTLAKWLVKEGDTVQSGDLIAEIETDKATMEFEAVDEGVIAQILVPAGTDNVKVGTVIAMIAEEGEDAVSAKAAPAAEAPKPAGSQPASAEPVEARGETETRPSTSSGLAENKKAEPAKPESGKGERIKASPLARRIADQKGVDLADLTGSGPNGRIIKVDVEGAQPGAEAATTPAANAAAPATSAPAPAASGEVPAPFADIPHTSEKLSNMRKTIARRLTEAKQTIPHIYLTVDIRLDALLKLRGELNASLEPRGIKLSVNDMLIKALATALKQVPKCNVSIFGDQLVSYDRADISVAVSVPNGLITPIITGADGKAISAISTEMGELAGRAKEGKLQPHEYQGGTASLSNMGMFGIKQFDAVINPPQGMILAVGAGEKRPYIVDDALAIATVMSATGSFDHRAIDGADGAQLMKALKELIESPLGLVA